MKITGIIGGMITALLAVAHDNPLIKQREQPLRPKVAVVLDGDVYVGDLDEKVAGGLWAVTLPADGGEVLLGVFRMGEILDPVTMTPKMLN